MDDGEWEIKVGIFPKINIFQSEVLFLISIMSQTFLNKKNFRSAGILK